MSSSPLEQPARAESVSVDAQTLTVRLTDGRVLAVPLAWFPRLAEATDSARARWRILGDGEGIRWPELDEDLSVEGLLAGNPGRRGE